MKKNLFFLFLLFLLSGQLVGQDVSLGIKAGVNLSEWVGQDTYSSSLNTGFHVGPSVLIKASDRISVEPALLYSQKGTVWGRIIDVEFEEEAFYSDATYDYRFSYLEMPVLVRFNIFSNFDLYLGPQFSYLIKTTSFTEDFVRYDREREYHQERKEEDLKGYNKFDLGIAGGVGYLFGNGLNINAGYDFGLYSIKEEGGDGKIHNRVIKLSVGYYF